LTRRSPPLENHDPNEMSISTQYARGGTPSSLIKNLTVNFLDTILLARYQMMVVFTLFLILLNLMYTVFKDK